MRADSIAAVDRWWAGVLGVATPWQGTTVLPHTGLGDYPGWYVAWRGDGVHVSAPPSASAADLAALQDEPLTSAASWAAFGAQRGLELRGPATHAYLDEEPPRSTAAGEVEELDVRDLDALREELTPSDWEAWVPDEPALVLGLRRAGRVVAAATLADWDGTPRDVAVVVHPEHRGRGLAEVVGGRAASCAVREHGLARWRAVLTNAASLRTAERLGFEPWCTQLALRPRVE